MRAHVCSPRSRLALVVGLGVALLLAGKGFAGDDKKGRDIYDYEAQKAAKGVKKIVFVADTAPHGGRGNHEFLAAAIYLARTINERCPDTYAVVHTMAKWPKDLKHADSVIVLLNHGRTAVNPAVKEAMARGAGFAAIHYGVEVSKGEQGQSYLKWLGGYFEAEWSVNPFWTPSFKDIPTHEITRGVKPFSINDEWYYHMRFVEGMKGVTPLLSAVAPPETITKRWKEGQKPSSHAGNPAALAAVVAGKPQVVAWAYERPDGGRGFGFTGLHKHSNLGDDNFRTLLLNAVAWVSRVPVPANGIASTPLNRGDLEQLIDDGKLAVKRRGI
ncbi:MAG TPA: ThuA domain-containing protein [Gemmataceae bacterium]|nr:ThuA domain-containing protein [Gemmataceae bacterium]